MFHAPPIKKKADRILARLNQAAPAAPALQPDTITAEQLASAGGGNG